MIYDLRFEIYDFGLTILKTRLLIHFLTLSLRRSAALPLCNFAPLQLCRPATL